MRSHIGFIVLGAVLAVALTTGCGGPQTASYRDVLLDVKTKSGRAFSRANETQREVVTTEDFWYAVRYNPPTCPCPPFEIWRRGRWQRASFVAEDEDDTTPGDFFVSAIDYASDGHQPLYAVLARDAATTTQLNEHDYPVYVLKEAVAVGPVTVNRALGEAKSAPPWVPPPPQRPSRSSDSVEMPGLDTPPPIKEADVSEESDANPATGTNEVDQPAD